MSNKSLKHTKARSITLSIVALMNEDVIRPLDDLVATHGPPLNPNQLIKVDGKITLSPLATFMARNAQHLMYEGCFISSRCH